MYFSSAPLQDVASVQVFFSAQDGEKNTLCKGMLFRYNGGGQRAVGQCRLHVDPCELYVRPSAFYFQHCRYSLAYRKAQDPSGVRIRVQIGDLQQKDGGWKYAPFDDGLVLYFWFTDEDCYIDLGRQPE
jgi:hypothetical protein